MGWGERPTRARLLGGIALAAGTAGAAGLIAGPPLPLLDRLAALYPGCTYRFAPRAPAMALTIDDGPDPATTPLILEQLRRHGARATFFVIAGHIRGQDSLMRRIVAEGHELGNHFTRDRPSIGLTADEFARDLEAAHRALVRYDRVRWARPGSGWYSRSMITAMEEAGYRCALGSIYPYDAAIPSSAYASWFILRNLHAGGVIVLHDGGARGYRTARTLAAVLPRLRTRGARAVTLSELDARQPR